METEKEETENWMVAEMSGGYSEAMYPMQKETYEIIGICMEVHRILGPGFKEIIYKDALEREFVQRSIPYEREKKFQVLYKGEPLPHAYFADFVVYGNIIFEVKSLNNMSDLFYGQVVNYLAASKLRLGLLINFGERSLKYRRLIFDSTGPRA